MKSRVKNFFEKLSWLRSYLNFDFFLISRHFVTILETQTHFKTLYLLKLLGFSKKNFTSVSMTSCPLHH